MWWKEYRITKIKSKNIFNSESFGNILKCINNRLNPLAPPTTCKPSEFAKGLISYFQLYFKLQANQVSLFNIELGHKTFQQKYGWLIFVNVQYQITRRVFVWQIYIDVYVENWKVLSKNKHSMAGLLNVWRLGYSFSPRSIFLLRFSGRYMEEDILMGRKTPFKVDDWHTQSSSSLK